MIEVKGLTKCFQGHTALNQVTFKVPSGSIVGLLGPNGAGKTSLIRILNQIYLPDEGEVYIDGRNLKKEDAFLMGYLPEERGLYRKMKVKEQLLYLGRLKGLQQKEALQRIAFWLKRLKIEQWENTYVESLSKGMQQKIQFIATVLHQPRLIVLDEPFSGFDPINAEMIKKEILRLHQEGATIILSTHRMESVEELCQYVVLLHQSNKVLEGEVSHIKEQFKENQYLLESKTPIRWEGIPVKVLKEVDIVTGKQYTLSLEEVSTSELLLNVASQVEITRFEERIPSMQEIFMKATLFNEE
ncbi:ABC transporter ATP-binding protein [Algivirga pacifica]|uniref:ABC transporter ATP-binding protein n=1 Tax=Algivirga pacifica TaxID=1162670 RepID=A0ABP9DD11_9BACT